MSHCLGDWLRESESPHVKLATVVLQKWRDLYRTRNLIVAYKNVSQAERKLYNGSQSWKFAENNSE